MRKLGFLTGLMALVLAVASFGVRAEYPDRPIRFVAATTAGGTADILGRAIAEAMSKVLSQAIIVDNKPGADQIIGMEYVAKGQPADGYTVLVSGIDGQALLPLTKKGLRFDPMKDLTLVAWLGDSRYVLAGSNVAPYKSFKELMDFAKANPGKLNFGFSSPQTHFTSAVLAAELGVSVVPVPFPGAAPYITAALANTVDWGVFSEGTVTGLKSRFRVYGITGKGRSTGNPEAPTFAELGFPRLVGPGYALAVRTGTPQAIIDKLSAAAAAALVMPEVKASAQKAQLDIGYEKAEVAQRALADRYRFYEEYAKKGIFKTE